MSDVDSPSALEPLSSDYSSVSPSPPPVSRKQQPKASAKAAGLDSSSELSELTEDEQEGTTRSSTSHTSTSAAKKKRGSIVPAPMWGWAYKGKKPSDNDDNNKPPSVEQELDDAAANATADVQDNMEEKIVVDGPSEKASLVDAATLDDADEGGEPPEGKLIPAAADNEDSHDEEDVDDAGLPLHSKVAIREGSTELSDVSFEDADITDADESLSSEHEDEDEGESEAESESDAQSLSDNEREDHPLPEPQEDVAEADPDEDPPEDEPAREAEPVVPVAPAGSSIMAGQQLIKTPTPSPSTSPEPEELPGADADADAPDGDLEADAEAEAEVEAEPEVDIDLAENGEVEAEAEADEAELDLQPAHRAEALDVLAGIELRFALLRERLYVEKMEDLAMEEAMVLQGIHPEMIHLQNELQVRHDRRLELAAKKRRYEDAQVTSTRKADESAVWSWWKFERDKLQEDMYEEANRKRRKLEREKRVIERPLPVRRIPPPPPSIRHRTRQPSLRDVVKNSSLDSSFHRSRSSRKRKDILASVVATHPQLHTLTPHEINNDLQIINSRRGPALYNQQAVHPLDVGVGIGIPPGVGVGIGMGTFGMPTPVHEIPPQIDYVQNNANMPMGHGLPGGPPPMQSYSTPGPGRPYHHVGGAPPLGSLPISNAQHGRTVQGPGMNSGAGPGTLSPFLGPGHRNARRSPSPPPGAGYGHGAMNGVGPYGGPNGPGIQNGVMAGPSGLKQQQTYGNSNANANGWSKEHRDRDKEREREPRRERKLERPMQERERDREPNWPDEDPSRPHIPHRLSSQIPPQGQGVHHHHHHVVHAHGTHHHHLAPTLSAAASPLRNAHHHALPHTHQHQHGSSRRHELDRHASGPDLDSVASASSSNGRRHAHAHPHVHPRDGHVHAHNHVAVEDGPRSRRPPPGPGHFKGDEVDVGPGWERERGRERNRDRDRDRDRDREQPMSHPGAPPSTRPQVTSFVMTPSQAMQGYSMGGSPSRRDANAWGDEGLSQSTNHRRQIGDSRVHRTRSPSRHSLVRSPPPPPSRRVIPQESPPMGAGPGTYQAGPSQNHLHSPSSRYVSSPRYGGASGSATPKGSTRPISPVPVKTIPQTHAYGPPPPSAGPGTPGEGRGRLGTPGLAGPGARSIPSESGAQPPNGYGSSSPMFPAVSALQSANASDSPRGLPPSKMSVVQLGNGS